MTFGKKKEERKGACKKAGKIAMSVAQWSLAYFLKLGYQGNTKDRNLGMQNA